MKNHTKFLSAVIAALALPAAAHAASTLTQAQITQIVKDVKTVDTKGTRAAVMKETLQGEQSVKTGIDSRTELLFNDNTVTRLGSNTHFSFTEGTRTMSLQSGVMLMQVPKNSGGAKIETAAVTAAVTGTTIMVEAGKDYTKLIVLEGECCLWPKEDKKGNKFFKYKHKTCATAGQEIIMRNGDKEVPDAVYVNLKLLEGTSLLLTGNWNAPIDHGPINAASDDQRPKDFIPTNLAIVGAGTDVVVIQGQALPPPNSPPAPPGPTGPPGKFGPLVTITTPNPYVINNTTVINTDPTITTGGVVSYGKIYRGTAVDGFASNYLFGVTDGTLSNTFGRGLDQQFPAGGVAVYKFESLVLQDTPNGITTKGGPVDLALVANGNISTGTPQDGPTTLDFTGLNSLTLATENGTINLGDGFVIQGLSSFLSLYTGAHGLTINSDIDLGAIPSFAVINEGPPPPVIPVADLIINTGGVLTIGSTVENYISFGNGVWNATGGMFLGGHINASNNLGSLTLNSANTITFGSPIDGESSSSINATYLFATGKNIDEQISASLDAFQVALNATNTINIDGNIYAYFFSANTTSGTGALPVSGIDIDSSGETGFVDATNISVYSRGYVALSQEQGEGAIDFINSLEIDHNDYDTLNLTGTKLEITTDFSTRDSDHQVTMNLQSNFGSGVGTGNIKIDGVVDVTNFNATAANTIYADPFAEKEIYIRADSVSLNVGVAGTLTQDSDNGNATLGTFISPDNSGSIDMHLGDFNHPTYSLSITTMGDLTLDSDFSDSHNGAFSEQGVTNMTLNLQTNYDNNNFRQTDIILNGSINVNTVNLYASGEIRGEGTVTATYANLQVGVDATLISSVTDLGSGNFATNTTLSYGDENSVRIILDDEGNTTNQLSIAAENLTVGDEGNPGFNWPNLNLSLTSFGTLTVNGSIYVSGFYGYTSNGFAGSGDVTANSITLVANPDSTLTNTVTPIGSSSTVTTTTFGPSGSALHIILDDSDNPTSQLNLTSNNNLTVATDFSAPYLSTLTLSAGDSFVNPNGALNINGTVTVSGQDAVNAENAGGDGGTVNLSGYGSINVNKPVIATTGKNGTSVNYGGAGGTVNLTSYGTINVNDRIEVSSSTGLNKSNSGGTITATSHKATGVAINVANTGQLNSLLAAAAPGSGGSITFLADGGGNIAVSGSVRADKGTVDIRTSGTAAGVANANIALSGANISADTVKIGALGNNGTLTIGGGSINGDTAIKLYAGGSNGTVNFIGNTSLSGASVKTIAGNTVNVFNGVSVNVSGGAATVFTNNANYTGSGGNGTRTGQFTGNGATTQPLANKPAF